MTVFLVFATLVLTAHVTQVMGWHRGMRSPFREDPVQDMTGGELTLILPVRNEAETLPQLLADLAAQSRQPTEVIVVDDASEDGTRAAVESTPWPFPCRVIDNPGQGKKAGLSAGIQACQTAWAIQVDADTRVGPQALAAVSESLAQHGDRWDMALLPLRLATDAQHAPRRRLDRLQALDFAAMQGWAVTAVDRGRAAMASGGGWVWRNSAFPQGQLRPDLPSGDDVFALAALIERGDQHRVGRIDHQAAMVSAAPMPTLRSLLHQRIRWGAKTAHYPPALREARRVALVVAAVHGVGLAVLILNPMAGLVFWSIKSTVDMVYTSRVGRAYGLLPSSRFQAAVDLLTLAWAHPLFIATTLLLMPVAKARWKGRPAT